MFGSDILEVAIGVIFVFILVSIICTALREGIEAWLKTRAAYLEHGIRQLLADTSGTGLANAFYNHPLIYGLYNGAYTPGKDSVTPAMFAKGKNLPSYIPSKNFALALMDMAARGPATDVVNSDAGSPIISLDSIRANVANLGNPAIQRLVLNAVDTAQGDLNKAQASLEDWYNSGMDRISGWYKRSSQIILIVLGLVIAIGLNINTFTIADYLNQNKTSRDLIVAQAGSFSQDSTKQNYENAKTVLNTLKLPIGWSSLKVGPGVSGILHVVAAGILGWIFTALATSLGAPFWFDILNKVMLVRATVKPTPTSTGTDPTDKPQPASKPLQQPAALANIAQALPAVVADVGQVAEIAGFTMTAGAAPKVADDQTAVDGCDVTAVIKTLDEDLPLTQGGVK